MPGNARHQLPVTAWRLFTPATFQIRESVWRRFLQLSLPVAGKWGYPRRFFPRFTLIFPAGDSTLGRGAGSFGVQTNLPFSVVLSRKLVSHWNGGATYFPHARDASGDRLPVYGYNLGQSFIWLTHTRFNVMLETMFTSSQAVVASNRTQWTNSIFLSPGIRWSYNFRNGLQIVPGVGVPLE